MARKFTRRKNGLMMTTFRVRIDLSQAQIDDLIGRARIYYGTYGEKMKIEEILEGLLSSGIESWTLDRNLDPDQEDQD
jgi:hypothetical protein